MKDLYNIVEGLFDIDSNKEFDDKYTKGKSQEDIDWMMEHSHPKDNKELKDTIYEYCNKYGWKSDLNWIDVSKITSMSNLFWGTKFNGDISKWDVSNVISMSMMFDSTPFNGDIKDWNVSKVKNMNWLFRYSQFHNNIENWDVRNVEYMRGMFAYSEFDGKLTKWKPNKVTRAEDIFHECQMKDYPDWYKKWYGIGKNSPILR